MTDSVDQLPVIVFTPDTKGAPDSLEADLLGDSPGGVTTIGTLRENLSTLLPGLNAIITDVKDKAASSGLQEVTVALGISAKGSIGFLGTGTELSGTASITLKFKTA
jgi:hypothetical protein